MKLLLLLIIFCLGFEYIQAQTGCPVGSVNRDILCEGRMTSMCLPSDYTCRSCWKILWPGLNGNKTGDATDYADSYDEAIQIIEKFKKIVTNHEYFGTLKTDYFSYKIYLVGGNNCKAIIPDKRFQTDLKGRIMSLINKYSTEKFAFDRLLSSLKYKPGSIVTSYRNMLAESDKNVKDLENILKYISAQNLDDIEGKVEELNNDSEQLNQIRESIKIEVSNLEKKNLKGKNNDSLSFLDLLRKKQQEISENEDNQSKKSSDKNASFLALLDKSKSKNENHSSDKNASFLALLDKSKSKNENHINQQQSNKEKNQIKQQQSEERKNKQNVFNAPAIDPMNQTSDGAVESGNILWFSRDGLYIYVEITDARVYTWDSTKIIYDFRISKVVNISKQRISFNCSYFAGFFQDGTVMAHPIGFPVSAFPNKTYTRNKDVNMLAFLNELRSMANNFSEVRVIDLVINKY